MKQSNWKIVKKWLRNIRKLQVIARIAILSSFMPSHHLNLHSRFFYIFYKNYVAQFALKKSSKCTKNYVFDYSHMVKFNSYCLQEEKAAWFKRKMAVFSMRADRKLTCLWKPWTWPRNKGLWTEKRTWQLFPKRHLVGFPCKGTSRK